MTNNLNNKKFKIKSFKHEEVFNIDIDSNILDMLLIYCISYNRKITRKCLVNLRKFTDIINIRTYEEEDIDKFVVLETIKWLLDLRLDENITSIPIICQKIKEHEDISKYEGIINFFDDVAQGLVEESDSEEINFINKYVESRLTYSYIFKYKDRFKEVFNLIDSNPGALSNINEKFVGLIEEAFVDIRNARTESDYITNDFELFDKDKREYVVSRTVEEYKKPNNRIKTGLKNLNFMLNGGLENGRFYLVCGVPKSFKSGTLLQFCMWTCLYNKNFILKDSTKVPTVFYLSMENSVKETLNRIYTYLTGKSIKDTEMSIQELSDFIMKKLGVNGVNLVIKYRPNKSISTLDFDAMIDEIEANGNEVILAVQDYTKRIRSSNYNPELRIELANISDDFCSIAKSRNIPVLSAGQLNRMAYQEVERCLAKGIKDIAKQLNASHIGESVGLIENADVSLIINREKDENDETSDFLSWKLMVSREEETDFTYFAQKFENGMKLEEDINLAESLSVDSIGGGNIKNGSSRTFNPKTARKSMAERKGSSSRGKVVSSIDIDDNDDIIDEEDSEPEDFINFDE